MSVLGPIAEVLFRFCGHDNPEDVHFCSACGVQVNLLLCPGCGTMNDNVASACHKCQRPLWARTKELPDTAPPEAPVAEPVSRRAN